MSSIKCDFCGAADPGAMYRPYGTKRGALVTVCKNCGLVYTITQDVPYSREPNVSGDADWGNVRFCKTQRFDDLKGWLPDAVNHVLDVGSSRGHFVRWVRQFDPEAEVTAIEPDDRIASAPSGVKLITNYLENVDLPKDHYDFIYCVQTLEHSNSASAMLLKMRDLLAPGGRLYVEVPNLEVCDYPYSVEEFFIDKHNFHFDRHTLRAWMVAHGFRILRENDDNLNVQILATKAGVMQTTPITMYTRNVALITKYSDNMRRNRAKLPAVVSSMSDMLKNMKVAFFGANTLFDLMVKYGGLDPDKVGLLVDDYLSQYVDKVHGVKVEPVEKLRVYQPDVCVILGRFGADKMAEKAIQYGIRNVVKFTDLLESV